MPHKRTPEGTQKQKQRKQDFEIRKKQSADVKRYVFSTSFHDKLVKEIVCTQTIEQIDSHLKSTFTVDEPQMYFPVNEGWVDGLVLFSGLSYEFQVNSLR